MMSRSCCVFPAPGSGALTGGACGTGGTGIGGAYMPGACGMLPPTANYRMPDAECDLDVIPNRARAAQVEYALSNSFAFGGLNAVLAFKKA